MTIFDGHSVSVAGTRLNYQSSGFTGRVQRHYGLICDVHILSLEKVEQYADNPFSVCLTHRGRLSQDHTSASGWVGLQHLHKGGLEEALKLVPVFDTSILDGIR